jgi:hypothetical protein
MKNPSIVDRTLPTATQAEIDYQNSFELLTNVWNLNGPVWFLGVLAVVMLISIALTVRVIQNVNLAGAIRYLWVIAWVIPLQVRFSVNVQRFKTCSFLIPKLSVTGLLGNWLVRLFPCNASLDQILVEGQDNGLVSAPLL